MSNYSYLFINLRKNTTYVGSCGGSIALCEYVDNCLFFLRRRTRKRQAQAKNDSIPPTEHAAITIVELSFFGGKVGIKVGGRVSEYPCIDMIILLMYEKAELCCCN